MYNACSDVEAADRGSEARKKRPLIRGRVAWYLLELFGSLFYSFRSRFSARRYALGEIKPKKERREQLKSRERVRRNGEWSWGEKRGKAELW